MTSVIHNFWFIQFIGAIGIVYIVLAWNAKTRIKILRTQNIGALFFVIHFFLLGATMGALMNIVTFVRNSVFAVRDERSWAKSPLWVYFFMILGATLLAIFWQGWPSILPVLGIIFGTYALSRDNPKQIRLLLLLTSAVWIPYMIVVHSYSGLISQIITTAGLLVGVYRLDMKKNITWYNFSSK